MNACPNVSTNVNGDNFWTGVLAQPQKNMLKCMDSKESLDKKSCRVEHGSFSLSKKSSSEVCPSAIGYMSARVLNNNPSNDSSATATGAVGV